MGNENVWSVFLNELYNYLTLGNRCKEKRGIIKRHSSNFETKGDLSFPINIKVWENFYENCKNTSETDVLTYCKINGGEDLLNASQYWTIQIKSYHIDADRAILYLNRILLFKSVIKSVLDAKDNYGLCEKFDFNTYSVSCDFLNDESSTQNLTNLRAVLLQNVTKKLLVQIGHKIQSNEIVNENNVEICLNCNKLKNNLENKINVQYGAVLDSNSRKKSNITADEYYRKRTVDMQLMAQHKYGLRVNSSEGWKIFFNQLGNAAVIIDLLQVKPSHTISININNPNCTNSKGASFILYNCARLATIFKKFNENVISQQYPELPNVETIDFGLLKQPEEWELLYNFVMQYPSVIQSCIADIDSGHLNPQYLCTFLSSMCLLFSVYYRRVRILTENRSHLLPVMFSRLYLLKVVEIVLHSGFNILDIKPVKQM